MGTSLKELKKNRLTPTEKWLLERIEGCEPETQSNGDVDWYKDGYWLFQQDFKNGWLFVSNTQIWAFLDKEFGLNYSETQELIKNVMYDYTNNGSLTPRCDTAQYHLRMYDYTNNGELTPQRSVW